MHRAYAFDKSRSKIKAAFSLPSKKLPLRLRAKAKGKGECPTYATLHAAVLLLRTFLPLSQLGFCPEYLTPRTPRCRFFRVWNQEARKLEAPNAGFKEAAGRAISNKRGKWLGAQTEVEITAREKKGRVHGQMTTGKRQGPRVREQGKNPGGHHEGLGQVQDQDQGQCQGPVLYGQGLARVRGQSQGRGRGRGPGPGLMPRPRPLARGYGKMKARKSQGPRARGRGLVGLRSTATNLRLWARAEARVKQGQDQGQGKGQGKGQGPRPKPELGPGLGPRIGLGPRFTPRP